MHQMSDAQNEHTKSQKPQEKQIQKTNHTQEYKVNTAFQNAINTETTRHNYSPVIMQRLYLN